MKATSADLKFLYAFSLPALLVFFSIIGADHWDGYWLTTGPLILAGGICVTSILRNSSFKYVAGFIYVVVLGLMMVFLP